MTILCCGDRHWDNTAIIRDALLPLGIGTIIIHGDARGADTLCGIAGRAMGYQVVPVSADWERYGKAAGPVRNRTMLKLHPEIKLVLAFHDQIHASKGTRDMIDCALAAGIVVHLHTLSSKTVILPRQPKLI